MRRVGNQLALGVKQRAFEQNVRGGFADLGEFAADDAAKRRILRQGGTLVLAITAQDLALDESDDAVAPPSWFKAPLVQKLNAEPTMQHTAAAREALLGGPLAFLTGWVCALTALTAVLAMIPLSRSAFYGSMAVAIMGGLIVATALTLLFLPALYAAWFRVRPAEAAG